MALELGYVHWTARTFEIDPYLDGHVFNRFRLGSSFVYRPMEADMPNRIGTHAMTDVIQPAFSDELASNVPARYEFIVPFTALDEEDFEVFEEAVFLGAPVDFIPGLWVTEVFSPVSAGDVRVLTRGMAWTTYPGSTNVTHPAKIKVNGAVNLSAATFSGPTNRVVTFADAIAGAKVSIRYFAAFRVKPRGFPAELRTHNGLYRTVEFEECVLARS
jgi:hypothetical protein